MRLIDADELKQAILELPDCENGFSDTYDKDRIIDIIDDQPSVEGKRKVGERIWKLAGNGWIWKLADNEWADWTCSNCGYTENAENTDIHVHLDWKYCPNCGFYMRRKP